MDPMVWRSLYFDTSISLGFSTTFGEDQEKSVASTINQMVFDELDLDGWDFDDDEFVECDFTIRHHGAPYEVATRFAFGDEYLMIAMVDEVEAPEEKSDKQKVHEFFYGVSDGRA